MKLSISPKPRCSSALLFSIRTSFLLSISFSLCLREISRCRKAHLSSTSLEISATAAFTSTSMIEDSCVWKATHVAMLSHLRPGTQGGGGWGYFNKRLPQRLVLSQQSETEGSPIRHGWVERGCSSASAREDRKYQKRGALESGPGLQGVVNKGWEGELTPFAIPRSLVGFIFQFNVEVGTAFYHKILRQMCIFAFLRWMFSCDVIQTNKKNGSTKYKCALLNTAV